MEERSQRTLAYTLAKSIDISAFDQVSGGADGGVRGGLSSRESLVPSGSGFNNMDVVIDVSVDW